MVFHVMDDGRVREKGFGCTRPSLPRRAVQCRVFCNYSGMLIGLPIAILYFLARKITAEGAEER
ncbi:MAG: hypothetical protein U9N36_04715, partial [Euryarchaeota archaeon]|nr:hypothetical protein [Euryarchaeota archaeon]